jgi:tRNA1Val (adenine37-N6)-methyltransferase
MPNDVFEFKKFVIKQDRCTMRVGTDAVLLGSWTNANGCRKILDVGTGTGILALMLAQKSNAIIKALEIDPSSFEQANENIQNSIFSERIQIIHQSFQEYCNLSSGQFDLIVSNPPYFLDSLKSNNTNRSLARHADALPFPDLVNGAKKLLLPEGRFCLILPKKEAEVFIKLAEKNEFHLNKLLRVRSMPDKTEDKRFLMQFEFLKKDFSEETLYIRTQDPMVYSEQYKKLTREFYLNF